MAEGGKMNAKIVLLALVMVVPAACSSSGKKDERMCPQVAIIRQLERAHDYGNDEPSEKTLVAAALMKDVKGRCSYERDGVEVTFDLLMVAGRGSRLGGDRVSLPFFVSVIAPDKSIVSKEVMTADFVFKSSSKHIEYTEQIRVFLPLETESDASHHQVLMGFQLTEEQVKEISR